MLTIFVFRRLEVAFLFSLFFSKVVFFLGHECSAFDGVVFDDELFILFGVCCEEDIVVEAKKFLFGGIAHVDVSELVVLGVL